MQEALQILERVNTFYSNAFSQLITFTVGLLAVVGVLIPIAIAAYQNRQLKHDQKSLLDKIENDLKTAKLSLSEQLAKDLVLRDEAMKTAIEDARSEMSKELKKIDSLASARSMHLQALSTQSANPGSSASDALNAAELYAQAGDERNLRAALVVWNSCIGKVSADHVRDYEIELYATGALKALETLNGGGRYHEDIRAIKHGLEEAKKRSKQPSQA